MHAVDRKMGVHRGCFSIKPEILFSVFPQPLLHLQAVPSASHLYALQDVQMFARGLCYVQLSKYSYYRTLVVIWK